VTSQARLEGHERLRLFLALELPDDVVMQLREWGSTHLSGGRPAERFHITLAFLGGQPRSALPGILDALRAESAVCPPFELEPLRYRETRSVGMLVLADPSGRATLLATGMQSRLERLGVYTPELRPWLPHVTVLRFRERPRLDPPLPALVPFAPSGAAAFLSRLHPSGARYEVLESCRLEHVEQGG
jgi:RNA 2',3'-cyclic 3'-phosphodiesterase